MEETHTTPRSARSSPVARFGRTGCQSPMVVPNLGGFGKSENHNLLVLRGE